MFLKTTKIINNKLYSQGMDPIKEAFSKIKKDINFLKEEINIIKAQIVKLTNLSAQTMRTQNQDIKSIQTDKQTHNMSLEGPYSKNTTISTGNRGVPTDRQTNRQTNRQTQNVQDDASKDPISKFKRANEILLNLDNVKREIRSTFKSLTAQEMTVFSTIYSLEDSKSGEITYKTVADILNLSESSIRDYVNKIIKKGILIDKIRRNNKTILLKISESIRNVASLSTIVELRGL